MNVGEAARFAAVGLAQNALNVGVFASLIVGGVGYLLASVVAACAALGLSYSLNRRWTFDVSGPHKAGELARYSAVFVGACVAGALILTLLVEVAGWRPVAAQVLAIIVIAPLSYIAQRAYAFTVDRA